MNVNDIARPGPDRSMTRKTFARFRTLIPVVDHELSIMKVKRIFNSAWNIVSVGPGAAAQ